MENIESEMATSETPVAPATQDAASPTGDMSFGSEDVEHDIPGFDPIVPEPPASEPEAVRSAVDAEPPAEPATQASEEDEAFREVAASLGLTERQLLVLGKEGVRSLYSQQLARQQAAPPTPPPQAPVEPPPDVTGLPEPLAQMVLKLHADRQQFLQEREELLAGQRNANQAILFQQFETAATGISKEMYGEGGLDKVSSFQAKARQELARTAEAIQSGRRALGDPPLPIDKLTKMAHLALHGEQLAHQAITTAATKSKAHAAGSVTRPTTTPPPTLKGRELALAKAKEFAASKGFSYSEAISDEVGDF